MLDLQGDIEAQPYGMPSFGGLAFGRISFPLGRDCRLACQIEGGVSMSSLALGRGFHVDDFLPWYPIVCPDGCLGGMGKHFFLLHLPSFQVQKNRP